jgi:hypothetical protein
MTAIVTAALVYVILTFPLGYVWHLTLFRERYAALKVYRERVIPVLGLASMLIQGVAFAILYAGLIAPLDQGWFVKGLLYAALGGFLSWGFTTVAAAAKNPMTSVGDFFAIETAFTAVQWVPIGLLTALLVG